jgi:hypothetical protein
MKFVKIAFAVCFGSLMLATTGCGPSKALVAAQEYEKDMCACKDAACATDAAKKYADKQKDVATSVKSDETEAMTKHATAAAACMTKVSMPAMPAIPGMPKH